MVRSECMRGRRWFWFFHEWVWLEQTPVALVATPWLPILRVTLKTNNIDPRAQPPCLREEGSRQPRPAFWWLRGAWWRLIMLDKALYSTMLFHFCKWKSGKVKKLTLFIPQNACKITVFFYFWKYSRNNFWGNSRFVLNFCYFVSFQAWASPKKGLVRFTDVLLNLKGIENVFLQ
jgi:hypothetical protein